jgi:hypothetical protein
VNEDEDATSTFVIAGASAAASNAVAPVISADDFVVDVGVVPVVPADASTSVLVVVAAVAAAAAAPTWSSGRSSYSSELEPFTCGTRAFDVCV